LVTSETLLAEPGTSAQGVAKALLANRVFRVELNGHVFVPSFYIDRRYPGRQLESVCKILGNLSGGSKFQFFANPKG
jgi:hypothetical protein